jgi:hypothetical protein
LSGDYGSYQDLKALPLSNVTEEWNGSWSNTNNMRKVYSPANEQERLGQMLRLLSDDELNAIQALGAQAQRTATEVAQIDRQMVRLLGTSKKTGTIVNADDVLPEGSIAQVKARIAELNKALEMTGDATTRDKIRTQIADLKAELEMMNTPLTGLGNVVPLSVELLDTSKEALEKEMEELRKRLGLEPIKVGVTTDGTGSVENAKQTEQAWGAAANAISAIGGALQQIEDPSAKVAGIIMQAVANIALGFAQAAASPATGAAGVFGWIAAATAGLATMTATIASIKSVTSGSYASGGIIPGSSFSGDNQIAAVNAGELILNRAQTANLAGQLTSGGIGNLRLTTELSGENIRIALSNNNRRRGGSRGEYAISK